MKKKLMGLFAFLCLAPGALMAAHVETFGRPELPSSGDLEKQEKSVSLIAAMVHPGHKGEGVDAYLVLKFKKEADTDRLIAASCDACDRVELHQYRKVKPGVTAVEKIKNFTRKPVYLKEGSNKFVLAKLKKKLKAGDVVSLTLTFEKEGKIEFDLYVSDTLVHFSGSHMRSELRGRGRGDSTLETPFDKEMEGEQAAHGG